MAGKRYVSKYARTRITIQHALREPTNAGMKQVKPRIVAQFSTEAPLRPAEKQQALERMNFRGVVLEEDHMPLDPQYRISVFDTGYEQKKNGWSDATRELVERKLEEHPAFEQDFILVELPRLEAPWPSYDRTSAKAKRTTPEVIVAMTRETGVDPEHVIAFERENKNRAEVIAALEELVSPPEPAEKPVEVSA